MKHEELSKLDALAAKYPDIKNLVSEHSLLSKKVQRLESKTYHSAADSELLKNLKKMKLNVKSELQRRVESFA